jgi:hypothetical protein
MRTTTHPATGTTHAGTTLTPAARGPATSTLLACGAVAGPLFVAVALAQAVTRAGFDLKRHPFSMLSLGDLGWIQITNFVVSGLLFVASAVGMRRVLRGGHTGAWGPVLVGLFGVGSIGGGVFVADPALGFPIGAAQGPPATISWHGTLHGMAFTLGVASLIGACFVLARRFAVAGDRGWARSSVATGVAFVLLGGAGAGLGDWRLVAAAVVLGWGWVAIVAARLRTGLAATPDLRS